MEDDFSGMGGLGTEYGNGSGRDENYVDAYACWLDVVWYVMRPEVVIWKTSM
jgi:hypothetical protein